MGCGMSLCCKSTGTSLLQSARSRLFKPNAAGTVVTGNDYRDQLNEEGEIIDDYEKELQQLNDEILGGEDMSPPPTLDESMSDNDTSVPKIAAVVTSKTRESPQSVIHTSASGTGVDGVPEIHDSSEEAINAFPNDTLQEDALDWKLDASSDSFTEVADEKPPAVDAQSVTNEHDGESEMAFVATEETTNVALTPSDFDGIEETAQLEPQEEAIGIEEDSSQENTEDAKQITAEMVDVVNSSTPQAEGEIPVNEEFLNSSPLEELSGAREARADYAGNAEVVTDQLEKLENIVAEPTNSIKDDDDTPDAADIPMDSNGTGETVHPETFETVNEGEAVENELQEIVDEETPQEIGENISDTYKVENDFSPENAEKEVQLFAETEDVVSSSTPPAEKEISLNMELLNAFQLERETGADCVEDQEILINQLEEPENATTSPTNLAEHSNEDQQNEGCILTMDVPLLSSMSISDLEEACPVELAESNQLDTEDTGSVVVEDELTVAQGHDEEVKPFESSYLEEQIQKEDDALEDGERDEENNVKVMDAQNETYDGDKNETDEIQSSVPEAEANVISGIVDEQPSQAENIEEILTDVEYGDVTKGSEACEIHCDGDLLQDTSLIEDKSPFIQANEDFYQDVDALPEENADQDNMLRHLMEDGAQLDDGFPQDVDINDKLDEDANEAANDTTDAAHASYVEHHQEGIENLEENNDSPCSPRAENDGNHDQFPDSDLENVMTALDRTLETEDINNEKDSTSINVMLQNGDSQAEIGLEGDGKIDTDTVIGELEILKCDSGVAYDENLIQEDTNSMYLADATTSAENDFGFNAPSLTEYVIESESAIKDEPEAEPIDMASHIRVPSTEENHDLQAESDNNQRTSDFKDDVLLDDDFNELLYEGDKDVSNDDEEEIWSKLQKDLQLEEEEQRTLAAIKIQSTFRGYKSRKELNHTLESKNETENDNVHVVDDIENVPEDQVSRLTYSPEEPLENNSYGNGLTEALAGVTESIATVALIMTDTPQIQPPLFHTGEDHHDDEQDGNFENENAADITNAFSANQREVNDVAEEPMSNGEEIRNIQLIESYVITSSVADSSTSPEPQEVTNIENSEDNGSISFKVNDDSASGIGITEAEAVNSDPGVVFELYVESNETTNDGLLESYCLHREDTAIRLADMGSQQDCSVTERSVMDDESFTETCSNGATNQNDNAEAIEIKPFPYEHRVKTGNQADVKRVRDSQTEKTVIGSGETTNVDEITLFNTEEFSQHNELDPCLLERENHAATKIQAGFRGHQDRKRVRELKNDVVENVSLTTNDIENTKELENAAATKIQAGFRGHQDRKRIKNGKYREAGIGGIDQTHSTITEEKNHFNDAESSHHLQPSSCSLEIENAAATKIQAGYRGHQDRKRVRQLQHRINNDVIENDRAQCMETISAPVQSSVDGGPPNVCLEQLENAAATKIQAGFRGYQERKNIRHLKNKTASNNLTNEEETNFLEENCLFDRGESIQYIGRHSLEEENAAASKIQAGFRGHQDRKRVRVLKDSVIKKDVVDSGTANSKKETPLLDYDQSAESILADLENAAATKIQAGFRGHQDRRRVKNLQRRMTESDVGNDREKCTDTIPTSDQSNVKLTQENLCVNELENAAATKIQASFRGHQDRKKTKYLKNCTTSNDLIAQKETMFVEENFLLDRSESIHDMSRNSLEEENAAATKIQAGFRGHQDRKRVKGLKDSIIKQDIVDGGAASSNEETSLLDHDQSTGSIQVALENTAATKIQAGFRGHQDRKRVKNLQRCRITYSDVENNREKCIDTIPTQDKLNVEQCQENLCLNELENAAATKIQASFRGHQDRKKTKHLKSLATANDFTNQKETIFVEENFLLDNSESVHGISRNSLEEENAAATKIQAGFRGHQDRKRVKCLKDSVIKSNVVSSGAAISNEEASLLNYDHSAGSVQVDLENTAATKIQAGFRGHQDRKRVKNLKHHMTESDVGYDRENCTDAIPTRDQSNLEKSQENVCLNELENAAAIKIQAGFRGYQERKNIRRLKSHTISNDLVNEEETNLVEENCLFDRGEPIQHIGIKSHEEENLAAIKIQAGFRGHQDRKRVKHLRDSTVKCDVTDSDCARHNEEASVLEYDQTAESTQVDLENTAATKIQAGFRGHQDRKRLKNLRNHTDVTEHL